MEIGNMTHSASQVTPNGTKLIAIFSSNLNINKVTEGIILMMQFGDINRNYFNITLGEFNITVVIHLIR